MEPRLCFAGILPFSIDASGVLRVLLAKEHFGREANMWSGFAGRMERHEYDPAATAAREAHEESRGLLGTRAQLQELIESMCVRVNVSRGVHFLLPFQYISYLPAMFAGVAAACASADRRATVRDSVYLEKSEVRWFTFDELADLPLRSGFQDDIEVLRHALVAGRSNGASGTV